MRSWKVHSHTAALLTNRISFDIFEVVISLVSRPNHNHAALYLQKIGPSLHLEM
jgi:hypothetical protein